MSFLDKLAFWKKKDEFNLDQGMDPGLAGPNMGFAPETTKAPDLGLGNPDAGMPPMEGPQWGQHMGASQFGQTPGFSSYGAPPVTPSQPSQDTIVGKDIEVISAKLDSLRAILEAVNQRLANIERIAYSDHEKRRGW